MNLQIFFDFLKSTYNLVLSPILNFSIFQFVLNGDSYQVSIFDFIIFGVFTYALFYFFLNIRK